MALTGIASIFAEQENYQKALELLTLVLRYPPSFIAMIEDKSVALLDDLTKKLSEDFIKSAMTQSKSLVLKNVIADLLTD